MTKKDFFNAVASRKEDVLQIFLDILNKLRSSYCVIGGLAVNAYVEPVVSLDLDIVIALPDLEKVCSTASKKGFRIKKCEHSINLTRAESDLRIQLQTDARYQDFIRRSRRKDILGYKMKVAALEDVIQGKIWAYLDEQRRRSKRQKDLADIIRLIEAFPELELRIPARIRRLWQ
jgi:hypothetical protein